MLFVRGDNTVEAMNSFTDCNSVTVEASIFVSLNHLDTTSHDDVPYDLRE
ncbi:hypothetical protein GCM10028773_14300 [Spirosoma koreense]